MFEQGKPFKKFVVKDRCSYVELKAQYEILYKEYECLIHQYDSLFIHADSVEVRLIDSEHERDHWYKIANRLFTANQHAVYGRQYKPGSQFIPS